MAQASSQALQHLKTDIQERQRKLQALHIVVGQTKNELQKEQRNLEELKHKHDELTREAKDAEKKIQPLVNMIEKFEIVIKEKESAATKEQMQLQQDERELGEMQAEL